MNQSPLRNSGTPSDNWASGSERKKDRTLWVPAMIAGAVIFGAGCGSGLIVGWMGGTVSGLGDVFDDVSFEPVDIDLDVAFPDSVRVGESFELVVTITDTRGELRHLQDIDFSGTFCDNMTIDLVEPMPGSISIDPGYHVYAYDRSFDANSTEQFVFQVTPNHAGVFTGDIEVYCEDFNSKARPVSFVVLSQD